MTFATQTWCDYCGKNATELITDAHDCDICMECTLWEVEQVNERAMWKAKIQFEFGISSDSDDMEEIILWIEDVQEGNWGAGVRYSSWIADHTTLSVLGMITFVDQARGETYNNAPQY